MKIQNQFFIILLMYLALTLMSTSMAVADSFTIPTNKSSILENGIHKALNKSNIYLNDQGNAIFSAEQTIPRPQSYVPISLKPNDSDHLHSFGSSVAIYGNYIAVGTSSGVVYLFKKESDGQWNQVEKLLFSDAEASTIKVQIYKDVLVVGVIEKFPVYKYETAFYIYELNANDQWSQSTRLAEGFSNTALDAFSLHDNNLVIVNYTSGLEIHNYFRVNMGVWGKTPPTIVMELDYYEAHYVSLFNGSLAVVSQYDGILYLMKKNETNEWGITEYVDIGSSDGCTWVDGVQNYGDTIIVKSKNRSFILHEVNEGTWDVIHESDYFGYELCVNNPNTSFSYFIGDRLLFGYGANAFMEEMTGDVWSRSWTGTLHNLPLYPEGISFFSSAIYENQLVVGHGADFWNDRDGVVTLLNLDFSDYDGDGIPNLIDLCPGGLDSVNDSLTYYECNSDLDSDGIPNVYENSYGLNPLDPTDALLDSDSDGFNNLEEFYESTDLNSDVSHRKDTDLLFRSHFSTETQTVFTFGLNLSGEDSTLIMSNGVYGNFNTIQFLSVQENGSLFLNNELKTLNHGEDFYRNLDTAISGDFALIGHSSMNNLYSGYTAGGVYVYAKDDSGVWKQKSIIRKITESDNSVGYNPFGVHVALSKNTALISNRNDVFVYQYFLEKDEWIIDQKLPTRQDAGGKTSGRDLKGILDVSLREDVAIIHFDQYNENSLNFSSDLKSTIVIYQRKGETWQFETVIEAERWSDIDYENGTLYVGMPSAKKDNGEVVLYKKHEQIGWQKIRIIGSPDRLAKRFGVQLDVHGDMLAVLTMYSTSVYLMSIDKNGNVNQWGSAALRNTQLIGNIYPSLKILGDQVYVGGGFYDSLTDHVDLGKIVSIEINNRDEDDDNIFDYSDNCIKQANSDQANFDRDKFGDLCDEDDDNDGILDVDDRYDFVIGSLDEDRDFLTDEWERRYFSDIALYNGDSDPDGDGLINSLEMKYGSDPNSEDTDNDDILDREEIAHFSDPTRRDDLPEFHKPDVPFIIKDNNGYRTSEFSDPDIEKGDYLAAIEWNIFGVKKLVEKNTRSPIFFTIPKAVADPETGRRCCIYATHIDSTGLFEQSLASYIDSTGYIDSNGNGIEDSIEVSEDLYSDVNNDQRDDREQLMTRLYDRETKNMRGVIIAGFKPGNVSSYGQSELPEKIRERHAILGDVFSVSKSHIVTSDKAREYTFKFYYTEDIPTDYSWYQYDEIKSKLISRKELSYISGNMVVVKIVDGGEGDVDGVQNGRVVHSGGLAIGLSNNTGFLGLGAMSWPILFLLFLVKYKGRK